MSKRSNTKATVRQSHKSGLQHGQGYMMHSQRCMSDDELKILRDYVDEDARPSTVFGVDSQGIEGSDSKIRRSQVRFVEPGELTWVKKRLTQLLKGANQIYRFDVEGIKEMQIAKYDESEQGFFDWHMDISTGFLSRKISLSVPLNSPDEYEGGDLEFNEGIPRTLPQKEGCVVSFPSFVLHRVTPVTKGCRYSLVGWVHGPDWR